MGSSGSKAGGGGSGVKKSESMSLKPSTSSSSSDLKKKAGSKSPRTPKKSRSKTPEEPSTPTTPKAAPVVVDPDKVLFGVPLEVSVIRSDPDGTATVPFPIRHTIEYLDKYCLSVEGIYRQSGRHSKIQEFILAFNTGSKSVYGENEDPHTVAGVLKAFLRELPESILTAQLKPEFKQAGEITVDDTRNQRIRQLLSSLPPVNRETVKLLYGHLSRVAAKSNENKMTASNLTFSLCPDIGTVSTYMIDGYDKLFDHLKGARTRSLEAPLPKSSRDLHLRGSISSTNAHTYMKESGQRDELYERMISLSTNRS